MPLSLQRRRVGDITVITCSGRIIEGAEVAALQHHLEELLPNEPHLVLDLTGVQFLDSSGLGLLVRFVVRAQTARGDLKLCAVPDRIHDVLKMTKLATVFDVQPTDAAAIAAFYHRTESHGTKYRFDTEILCVDSSANVLAYVRELLRHAGYGVMTATNLPDALILLQATHPKLVVIAAGLHATRGTRAADTFHRLTGALPHIQLPADFSSHDAGAAGQELLAQIQARLAAGAAPVATTP